MMVIRNVLTVLCEIFSITAIMTNGQVEEDPLHGLNARQIWALLDFCLWGHLNTLVYAAPVKNEEALNHLTVDARQTIHLPTS
jgi:hypothetical protein